jgi:DNA-binding NarL/FixJ family response regulator
MQTTILVADDHQIVRQGIKRLLSKRGDFAIVAEASDGEQAVEIASRHQPDVVLMDISMPRLSGIDATRRIAAGGRTKVLALSMHDAQSYVEEALRAGASGYVHKNASAEDLFSAIDAVRTGESYLSPTVTQQVVDAIARPGDRPSSAVSALTQREREVLKLIADGLSSKEIAVQLGVSLKTIESHRANLMDKLDIHKVSGLVRFAVRAGLVAP